MLTHNDILNPSRSKEFYNLVRPTGEGKIPPPHQRISAPMIHRKKIPTAAPMLLEARNSTKLVTILCDASGSQKFKMAAHKQEYLYLSLYTS